MFDQLIIPCQNPVGYLSCLDVRKVFKIVQFALGVVKWMILKGDLDVWVSLVNETILVRFVQKNSSSVREWSILGVRLLSNLRGGFIKIFSLNFI